MDSNDFAIIIPVYNHARKIREVIEQAKSLNMPIFVIDDGSTDETGKIINSIQQITVLRHNENLGKGAALISGFTAAAKISKWAISIDADGQHNPHDALDLIQAIPAGARCLVIGKRQGMVGKNVPWTSRFGREFSNFWVWMAGGSRLTDSQSGFRIYPIPEVLKLGIKARRFQFEVEIIVKAYQQNIPILEAPVQVIYQGGSERVSHFRPFLDFMRNSTTFSRLICKRIFKGIFRFISLPIRAILNSSDK